MGIIHKLDAQLTNMIAAGEVVERPMGIVKELVENAIDAGSKHIEINIKNGGIDEVEIVDDGKGMDEDDLLMAFERHATSKIIKANDLWNIQTLGFRGEALPSIASVSKVEITSCDGKQANRLLMAYGQNEGMSRVSANQGTAIKVSGLFYKTPARLKHLRSGAYEASLINDLIIRFALSYPEIAFSLNSDGKNSFSSSGSNDLLEVIFRVYGKDVAKQAFAIEGADFDYHLSGYLIHPQFSKANKNSINIFMNQRMIKDYRLSSKVIEAYHDYIAENRYPIVVLNIAMDSKIVDVNVHPSKWEVRLAKQNQLELLIKQSLQACLQKHMNVFVGSLEKPKVKTKVETPALFASLDEKILAVEQPVVEYQAPQVEKEVELDAWKASLGKMEHKVDAEPSNIIPTPKDPILVENKPAPETNQQAFVQVDSPLRNFPTMQLIGQLHGKFILAQGEKGLYIIDQHAAQERVHYEEILSKINERVEMVDLLVPISLNVSADVVDRLEELNANVAQFQISFEAFGDQRLLVRSVPFWLQQTNEERFLMDLIDYFKSEFMQKRQVLQKKRIATMACHSSIRFNHVLSVEEMKEVIRQLSRCEQPYECPHGRPTFILLEDKVLEKEFLR
ncbi:MAG: DNA mismatch repair endonuclease MutL [Erysipelotrichaceae bacterium]|nr:DNA mismatch repair endonuclease MutL [Erysipelotrichaceae bacterium]MDY5251772.1 DNA mismatch repair endonuclease MutL [Erysipelotrichaceae bacterium]